MLPQCCAWLYACHKDFQNLQAKHFLLTHNKPLLCRVLQISPWECDDAKSKVPPPPLFSAAKSLISWFYWHEKHQDRNFFQVNCGVLQIVENTPSKWLLGTVNWEVLHIIEVLLCKRLPGTLLSDIILCDAMEGKTAHHQPSLPPLK